MIFSMHGHLQIGELAKLCGLSADAIRFYEKRELLPRANRTSGHFRLYSQEDVARIQFIQQMQGLGFSLQEIKQLVSLRSRQVESCEAVRQLLHEKLASVRAKITELRALESELVADLHKCDRELRHRRGHAASACPVLKEVANK